MKIRLALFKDGWYRIQYQNKPDEPFKNYMKSLDKEDVLKEFQRYRRRIEAEIASREINEVLVEEEIQEKGGMIC